MFKTFTVAHLVALIFMTAIMFSLADEQSTSVPVYPTTSPTNLEYYVTSDLGYFITRYSTDSQCGDDEYLFLVTGYVVGKCVDITDAATGNFEYSLMNVAQHYNNGTMRIVFKTYGSSNSCTGDIDDVPTSVATGFDACTEIYDGIYAMSYLTSTSSTPTAVDIRPWSVLSNPNRHGMVGLSYFSVQMCETAYADKALSIQNNNDFVESFEWLVADVCLGTLVYECVENTDGIYLETHGYYGYSKTTYSAIDCGGTQTQTDKQALICVSDDDFDGCDSGDDQSTDDVACLYGSGGSSGADDDGGYGGGDDGGYGGGDDGAYGGGDDGAYGGGDDGGYGGGDDGGGGGGVKFVYTLTRYCDMGLTNSMRPSALPTAPPSQSPTHIPTVSPSATPSIHPSLLPTAAPSRGPSAAPTHIPTIVATANSSSGNGGSNNSNTVESSVKYSSTDAIVGSGVCLAVFVVVGLAFYAFIVRRRRSNGEKLSAEEDGRSYFQDQNVEGSLFRGTMAQFFALSRSSTAGVGGGVFNPLHSDVSADQVVVTVTAKGRGDGGVTNPLHGCVADDQDVATATAQGGRDGIVINPLHGDVSYGSF